MRVLRPVLLAGTAALALSVAGCGDDEPTASTASTSVAGPVTRVESAPVAEDPVATEAGASTEAQPSSAEEGELARDRSYWEGRSAAQRTAIVKAWQRGDADRSRYDAKDLAEETTRQFATSPLKPRTVERALVEARSKIATDNLDDSLDDIDELTREADEEK